jgi:hypothetical protein
MATELIPKCMVTGNPCNTDTRRVGSDFCCPRCEAEYYKSKSQSTQKLIDAVDRFYKNNDYRDCKNPKCPHCNLIRAYEEYLKE